MNSEEANKVIAEYMGTEITSEGSVFCENSYCIIYEYLYSESLDALLPVWEKLVIFPRITEVRFLHDPINEGDEKYQVAMFKPAHMSSYGACYSDSIQEAACIATAKAILEVEK